MNSARLWALTAFIPAAAAVAWADTTLVKDRPFSVCVCVCVCVRARECV